MFDNPLAREIALVLAVKLLLLVLIWFAFFRPSAPTGAVDITTNILPAPHNTSPGGDIPHDH